MSKEEKEQNNSQRSDTKEKCTRFDLLGQHHSGLGKQRETAPAPSPARSPPPKIIEGFELAACCVRDRYTREIPCQAGNVETCAPRRAYLRRLRERDYGYERERTLERWLPACCIAVLLAIRQKAIRLRGTHGRAVTRPADPA